MSEADAEALHQIGVTALRAGGRLDEAAGALRNALVLSPGHVGATLDLAIARRGQRRFDASAELCRRAHALQPGWSDALYHLGRAHSAAERSGPAERALRHALAADPSMAPAWEWLGQARRRTGDPSRVRAAFRRAATLEPGVLERWTALAAFEAEHGHPRLASAVLGRPPALAPDDARAWLALSRGIERSEGPAAALPFAERALRLAPDLSEGHRQRIHFLCRLDRHQDAVTACLALLRLPNGAARQKAADRAPIFWRLGECAMRADIDVRLLPDDAFAGLAERLLALSPGQERSATAAAIVNSAGTESGSDAVPLFLRAMLARQLANAGWTPDEVERAGVLPLQDCTRFFEDETLPAPTRGALLPALGYSVASPRAWNGWLFERLVRPAIDLAVERRDIAMAHRLVTFTQWSFMVQPHTYEQARLCYERIAPPFRALGHRLRAGLGPLPPAPGRGIAFFMNTVETDPPFHLERAVNILLRNAGPWRERFAPIHLVAIDDVSDRFRDAYAAIGVTVLTPDRLPPAGSPDRILDLALRVRELGLMGVVFLNCVEGLVDLFAGMGIAPVQLFMSADFFHIDSPDLDGLLTFGSLGKWTNVIGGRTWRSVPFPFAYKALLPHPAETDLEHRAHAIRRGLLDRFDIILGSIGRPEKLSSEFLEAVARLLHANPEACFLWFGHQEPPAIRRAMEERGISDRCLFQGWVDTRLYARVLDIHLDSFPFPTGVTMVEVMLAGCAQVWMSSAAADQLSIGGSIERLMSGAAGTAEEQAVCRRIFSGDAASGGAAEEPLFLFSTTLDGYCESAQRLIDDPALRARLGQAGRAFAECFVLDETRPSNALFGHLADMIEAKSR